MFNLLWFVNFKETIINEMLHLRVFGSFWQSTSSFLAPDLRNDVYSKPLSLTISYKSDDSLLMNQEDEDSNSGSE